MRTGPHDGPPYYAQPLECRACAKAQQELGGLPAVTVTNRRGIQHLAAETDTSVTLCGQSTEGWAA